MLVYHPAFDIHHCVFRIALILDRLPRKRYEVDRIRIQDFYLLFPAEVSEVRLPRALQREKRQLAALANRYDRVLDDYQLFTRMEPYHAEALGCLASRELIDAAALAEGTVQRTQIEIPKRLKEAFDAADGRMPEAIEFLTGPFVTLPLYGRDGLRGRTKLFEYRYDAT